MSIVKRVPIAVGVMIALAAVLGAVHAQEVKEVPLSPNGVIRLEIKFDGPDADKITGISGNLGTSAQAPADQAGFMNNFPGEYTLTAPGTFRAEFKIPPTVISGDYVLNGIDVRAPGIDLSYRNGKDYNLHAFHIENHSKFVQPSVTIKDVR